MKNTIVQYWYNLKPREQLVLGLGGVILVIYIAYLLLFKPLYQSIDTKSQLLVESQETLNWLQEVEKISLPKQPVKQVTSGELLATLSKELNDNLLKHFAYHLEQTGSGEVELIFEKVPFNPFMVWLFEFTEKYNVSVKQFDVTSANEAGVVKLSVILK